MTKEAIQTMPERMRGLPIDPRGYPVPWFVAWRDGEPEFRAMDGEKLKRAVMERLCWVCGDRLGVHLSFVAGPMCGINRTTSEPPCHHDCAVWSAINCPFLSNPRAVRREDEICNNQTLRDNAAGIALARNPGVTMVWNTREYEIFNVQGKPLIQMGPAQSVEWYTQGRKATRAEVDESVESGLPALRTMARTESDGLKSLGEYVARFNKWLP